MKEEITYKSNDGITDIHAVIWQPTTEVKAIVQVAHGMTGYVLHYEEFANFLNKYGILVCGNDHLGHGQSVKDKNSYGYFAPKNSTNILVDDMHTLTTTVKQKYPNIPYILFGHSMGSFLVRVYLTKYSQELAGVVLTGSGYKSKIKTTLAKILATITQFYHHGWYYRSPFLNTITTGSYYRKFEEGKERKNCWLSTNTEFLTERQNDQLSKFTFTCNGYITLYDLVQKACSIKLAKQIKKDLPMLVLSGKDDPVGNFGKDIYKIDKEYKKAGINNIKIKLYNGMRHELLNETNNILPLNDILAFINSIKGE